MDSDTLYPTSSPAASDTVKIPFPNRLQFCEVDGTDDESSLNGRDKDMSSSKSGKPRASLTVTDTNCRSICPGPQSSLLHCGLPLAAAIPRV
jgi:hypothetical protein